MITFHIPSIPIAQPRQRHRISQTAATAYASNYTPAKHPVNTFKAAVQLACQQAYKGPPLEGPLSLTIEFYLPRPKNKIWKTKAMPAYLHTGKPDIDNLVKSVKDALTGLAWRDDSQVACLIATKSVCDGLGSPRVSVYIDPAQDW